MNGWNKKQTGTHGDVPILLLSNVNPTPTSINTRAHYKRVSLLITSSTFQQLHYWQQSHATPSQNLLGHLERNAIYALTITWINFHTPLTCFVCHAVSLQDFHFHFTSLWFRNHRPTNAFQPLVSKQPNTIAQLHLSIGSRNHKMASYMIYCTRKHFGWLINFPVQPTGTSNRKECSHS